MSLDELFSQKNVPVQILRWRHFSYGPAENNANPRSLEIVGRPPAGLVYPLFLSTGETIDQFEVSLTIGSGKPLTDTGEHLPEGIGLLTYFPPGRNGDRPSAIAGWLNLGDRNFDALWTCLASKMFDAARMGIEISGLSSDVTGLSKWNVERARNLPIVNATIVFEGSVTTADAWPTDDK